MYNIVSVCKKANDISNTVLFNVLDTSDYSIGALDSDTLVKLCISNNLSIKGVDIENCVIQKSKAIDVLSLYKNNLDNIEIEQEIKDLLIKTFNILISKPTDNALIKYENMLNKVQDMLGADKDLYLSYAKQALSGV